MTSKIWLRLKAFFVRNFCPNPADKPILAQQITPQMAFFVWTISGWNLAITGLSVVEFYFLHDLRLPVLAVTCWGLGVAALYHKRRLDRAQPAATPQDQAHLFTGWMVVAAVSWMLASWIIVPHEDAIALLFYCYCLGFVVAIHAASSASYKPGYVWFITPPFLFLTLLCGLYAHTAIYVVIAVTTPGVLLFTWILGETLYRIQRNSLLLQLENQQLIQSLIEQKEAAQAARTAAEHANLAKSRFLAAASHDLRQPIHAQGLFLDVLSRTQLDAKQHQLVQSIHAASSASSEMLHSLLDYSRLDAGVIEPKVSAFQVQAMLNKIEREFAPQADAKGLRYQSRESPLVVQSDPVLLELILRNLVANAIRYTERGGVLVVFRRHQGKAVCEVWDTGIGIAAQHQQDVFQEFHQLGNPQRDRRNGLGLGLAIVKAVTQRLGHPLSLKSSVGRGSVFRIEIPLAQQVSPVASAIPVDAAPLQLRDVRVLVIEDDADVRQGMLHLLRDWGCVCEGAQGIEDAVSTALALQPQVIVSDYRLAGQQTGVQAIDAVRAAWREAVPALLITGDTGPERLREALSSGVPLLHKPIAPEQLYQALIKAVAAP